MEGWVTLIAGVVVFVIGLCLAVSFVGAVVGKREERHVFTVPLSRLLWGIAWLLLGAFLAYRGLLPFIWS